MNVLNIHLSIKIETH